MGKLFLRLALLVSLTFGLATLAAPPLVVWAFKGRIHHFDTGLVRGNLSLLAQRYQAVPPAQWPSLTQTLNTLYQPMAVATYPAGDPALGNLEPARLAAGEVGIHMVQHGEIGAAALALGEGQVLVLSFPPWPLDISVLFWLVNLLISLFLVAGLLFWVRPHWHDLERVRLAAGRLAEGELGARSGLTRGSSIGALGSVFDTMAARIAGLIAQQRDLLGAVSHELRTPLSRLLFGLEMLSSRVAPADATLVASLQAHSRELQVLVDELLAFNTLRASNQPLERLRVDVPALLDSVVVPYGEEAERLGIELQLHVAEGLALHNLEPRLTARALQNILGNALRYARRQVTVSAWSASGALQVKVEDDGPGIPAAHHQHVFQPFFRLDASRDRATGGVGLGLAISRSCLERQGGTLLVSSAALGGACFTLCLAAVP